MECSGGDQSGILSLDLFKKVPNESEPSSASQCVEHGVEGKRGVVKALALVREIEEMESRQRIGMAEANPF